MKALVLAAGFGTRLKPFTNQVPKPLCPFFGTSFLDLALFRILPHVDEVAVNCHHLHEKISEHISNHWSKESIRVSYEAEIRGTGGALHPLKDWLDGHDLLIYNADIISNINIPDLITHHLKSKPAATMVMLAEPSPGKTPIYLDTDRVLSIGDSVDSFEKSLTFSGIHIVSHDFVTSIPDTAPYSIIDTYKEYLRNDALISFTEHSGFWEDLGTPESLWQGHCKVLDNDAERLLEELGVSNLRKSRGMPDLVFDRSTGSAWTKNLSFKKPPMKSFIELKHDLDISVSNSIVVHAKSLTNQPIHNCVAIDNIKKNF